MQTLYHFKGIPVILTYKKGQRSNCKLHYFLPFSLNLTRLPLSLSPSSELSYPYNHCFVEDGGVTTA
ncbi:hypothetical protein MtrunA17_Chr6g0477731 [Medicago truncatula]|uniref:Uncharacterized protein n=1 Tax=Medicago truncatula TaxID=3880 RepID=A0A396HMW0_MEDTR|nr:hypothetical protein MtrunA17_Chr6g0477731 [Medicago truncatula]